MIVSSHPANYSITITPGLWWWQDHGFGIMTLVYIRKKIPLTLFAKQNNESQCEINVNVPPSTVVQVVHWTALRGGIYISNQHIFLHLLWQYSMKWNLVSQRSDSFFYWHTVPLELGHDMRAVVNRKKQLQIKELLKISPSIHILNNKATDPEQWKYWSFPC